MIFKSDKYNIYKENMLFYLKKNVGDAATGRVLIVLRHLP